jgi:hypothetical protein
MATETHNTVAPAPAISEQEPAQKSHRPSSVHPVAVEIGLAATIWFLAMAWLSFAWGKGIGLDLGVVTLFCVIFFTLFLSQASRAVRDPRWRLRQESFTDFLHDDDIAIDRGTTRGRDVLIEVTLIPVALAFAATLLGLAWIIFG